MHIRYKVYVDNFFYSFMENLWLIDVLGMYTVLRQVLHGGIIQFLQTQFSSSIMRETSCVLFQRTHSLKLLKL